MSFNSDLEFIYETAKSDSPDAEVCRHVLVSLWDDGQPDGCELLKLLTLEPRSFEAVCSVLKYLYAKRVQIDMFMSTKQISALSKVEEASPRDTTPSVSNNTPYAHWS